MNRYGHFDALARTLHWLMAAMILTMLFVGVGMVVSLSWRPTLLDLHRPLGIAILLLVIVRLLNRLRSPPPPLPADLPAIQTFAAHASHWLLYGLMFAMPLIGWSMLSAGGYPIVLFGGVHLPAIAPHSPALYALLRPAHTVLAYVLLPPCWATWARHCSTPGCGATACFPAWRAAATTVRKPDPLFRRRR